METTHPVEGSFGNKFMSICSRFGAMAAWSRKTLNKNSSGDEIANVNIYAVRPEANQIRCNAK